MADIHALRLLLAESLNAGRGLPRRVLLTASRTWTDEAVIGESLMVVEEAARFASWPLTLVHGAAGKGGDRIGRDWVMGRRAAGGRWLLEPYPADWRAHRRAAGVLRNTVMVEKGADVCLAFIAPCPDPACKRPRPHGSHGAVDCSDKAESAGIPTWRCWA